MNSYRGNDTWHNFVDIVVPIATVAARNPSLDIDHWGGSHVSTARAIPLGGTFSITDMRDVLAR